MADTFTLFSDDLRATISTYGARLDTFGLRDGPDLILHADAQSHPGWHDVYPGAIVGPVANRVARGEVTIDTKTHQMPLNENGITALHSGPDGLDRQDWTITQVDPRGVQMECALQDGAGGLPGNRLVTVSYALEGLALTLSITATTDAPTPFNIAHHPYWHLGDVTEHRLQIAATTYLPTDANNLPTGEIADVADTPFDHRTARTLDPGLDHNFCLAQQKRDTPVRAATLLGHNGVQLQVDTTEPGLQVYSGAHLPTLPDTDIAPYSGIALEPQGWPDAVNHAHFPEIICTSDRPYRQITRYLITRAT